jgi:flagellar operon protein
MSEAVQSIGLLKNAGQAEARIAAARAAGVSFADVLKARTGEIKFSAHAQTRLKSRNIEMTQDMTAKLEQAVNTAAQKGCRDSLVLFSNCAFIVNVPNRTVVTAMDGENIRDNVFTNIDSTVIAG